MSAQPVDDQTPSQNWPRPPEGGYTSADLDRLPGLPDHTELIDGSLVFMSPQRGFHANAVDRLVVGLREVCPDDWRVRREMSVVLDDRQRPEPDVSVVSAIAIRDGEETWYPARAVLMAVEVVSPDSAVRDRERKPQLYAQAGIRHFWRVEEVDGKAVVYTYELDATGVYAPNGIHRGQLTTQIPFELDLDLDISNL